MMLRKSPNYPDPEPPDYPHMNPADSEREAALIDRILKLTQSPQSVAFYRKAIAALGEGIVDEEYGELRGQVNEPSRYFTALLRKRLATLNGVPAPLKASRPGSGPQRTMNRQSLSLHGLQHDDRSYQNSSGEELFAELAPIKTHGAQPSDASSMQLPYSTKTIP